MPTTGALVDTFGRVHTDLRISVTDRCNLRCTYCMADEAQTFLARDELLTFDEIERVARVARSLGVTAVRLTGGEPLMRAGLVDLVARLGALGFDDLALTTNGTALARSAPALAAAGLDRVNVSCDSLRPERFAAIRRHGELGRVLAAMDAAEVAGLCPVKVNVVLQKGVNDDEILDFAAFARATHREVRFIEFMPLEEDRLWSPEIVVPLSEIVARIGRVLPLVELPPREASETARRYTFADGVGEIGIIAPVSQAFCGACSRVRLTSDGKIRTCLFSQVEHDLYGSFRAGASDAELSAYILRTVQGKEARHHIGEPGFEKPSRNMVHIGG